MLSDLPASVVDANEKATTYRLNCSRASGSAQCPIPAPVTLINGPSTAGMFMTHTGAIPMKHKNGTYTSAYQCNITSTISATCDIQRRETYVTTSSRAGPGKPIRTGTDASSYTSTSVSSQIYTLDSESLYTIPLTITAGFHKLPPPTETSSGMGAVVTAGAGSGVGVAAAAGMAAAAVLLWYVHSMSVVAWSLLYHGWIRININAWIMIQQHCLLGCSSFMSMFMEWYQFWKGI